MDDAALLEVLVAAAGAVRSALASLGDGPGGPAWRRRGERPGQYHLDIVADAAACDVLLDAGLRVLSEESGLRAPRTDPGAAVGGEGDLLVVVDPVDGSTNAALGIPWYATSLCVLDDAGPRVALVVNQATGVAYEASRGGGASRDGRPIAPSDCAELGRAVVGISGAPEHLPGWWQFRALGAAALDLCLVAEGGLDAYAVGGASALHGWDFLGALLVCTEAGATAADADGADLLVRDATPRRPVVAATPELSERLLEAFRTPIGTLG